MAQEIAIGMIASISFAFIDALNFLIIETPLDKLWQKTKFLDDKTIPIVNGGIAAAISIFLAMHIESYLEHNYKMFKHPVIDAAGIIIGTVIVLLIYKFYLWAAASIKKRRPLPLVVAVAN